MKWPPDELKDNIVLGALWFSDGSQKMLAAMTCWVSLLMVWRHHGEGALQDSFVQTMIASFLQIPTMVKAQEAHGSQLQGLVGRIAQQNVNAKVQPISSFQWASMLKEFGSESFDEALTAYNQHPDVVAHDRSQSGSGSVALDGRKRQGVKNWVDRCSPRAFEEVLKSTHDLAYNLGAFGEGFSVNTMCFLQSKVNLEPSADGEGPNPNESFHEAA